MNYLLIILMFASLTFTEPTTVFDGQATVKIVVDQGVYTITVTPIAEPNIPPVVVVEPNLPTEPVPPTTPIGYNIYRLPTSHIYHLFADCYHIAGKPFQTLDIMVRLTDEKAVVCETCKKRDEKK